jgi:hypothetical protein
MSLFNQITAFTEQAHSSAHAGSNEGFIQQPMDQMWLKNQYGQYNQRSMMNARQGMQNPYQQMGQQSMGFG